jgi:hypothetical protein
MLVAGIGSAVWAGINSHALHPYFALAVLTLSAATSRMKVKLPGINGNMSVNLPFLLLAVVNLSAAEAVAIACVSTVVQCWPKRDGRFKPAQMLFNVSMMAFAASVAELTWHASRAAWASEPLMVAAATATFFLGQSAPVAAILKVTEGVAMRRMWMSLAQLTFPYYVVSAGITSMVKFVSQHSSWQLALVVFVMYVIHRSYRLYFKQTAEASPRPPLARAARAGA